jgi:hypothetical protein
MSNFLAHLIARASQQAPLLARRQPALFEPATAWTPPQTVTRPELPATQASPEMPPKVGPTRQELRLPHDRKATQDAVASHSASEAAVPQSMAAMPMFDDEVPRNVLHMTLAPAPIADVRTVGADKAPHVLPPAQPQPARDVTRMEATVVPRQQTVQFVDETPRPRKAAPLRQDVPPRPATEAAEAARQRPDPPTGVLLPARPQNAQAVQLAKTGPSRAAMPGAAAAQATNESVQITIGRVEVRAVAAADRPAPRPAKQAAPRLTLDDYLRQRSGGGR